MAHVKPLVPLPVSARAVSVRPLGIENVSDPINLAVPRLETSRLLLRALVDSDATDIFDYASDAEVVRFVLWPRHETIEDSRRLIARLNHPLLHSFAIVLKSTGGVVGMVFLHSYSTHHRKAELAFNISRLHWGHGYVAEAAGRVLEHGFSTLALNRIEATCMMENAASARVLSKLGFAFEGVMRKSHQRGGEFLDMKLFAKLATDPGRTAPPKRTVP